ncbi:hypothetical protein QC760_003389 [Botrytis cinerea]
MRVSQTGTVYGLGKRRAATHTCLPSTPMPPPLLTATVVRNGWMTIARLNSVRVYFARVLKGDANIDLLSLHDASKAGPARGIPSNAMV